MFAGTLVTTILIEGLALAVWHRISENRGTPLPMLPLLFWLSAANLFTQTLLYIALSISVSHYWLTLLLMEILIVILEAAALMIANLPIKTAARVSLLVNLSSFLTGMFFSI